MSELNINGARGEVQVEVDGRSYKLCLTLGALSEIETTLACVSLSDLDGRMKSLTAKELFSVLGSMVQSSDAVNVDDLVQSGWTTAMAARAVTKALHAALSDIDS